MFNRLAVATLAVGFTAPAAHAQFLVGEATDDVWAYDNASDPGGDPVIRLWGDSGFDLNPTGYPGAPQTRFFFSYGFASWDLSDVPPDYTWAGATVTLTVVEGSVYDPANNDVYLRILTDGVDENTWVFGVGPVPIAGDQNRLVGDDSDAGNGPGSEITFDIPANVPRSLLRRWAANGRIDVALTSDADFATNEEFLRIASNDNLLFDGPTLELK